MLTLALLPLTLPPPKRGFVCVLPAVVPDAFSLNDDCVPAARLVAWCLVRDLGVRTPLPLRGDDCFPAEKVSYIFFSLKPSQTS